MSAFAELTTRIDPATPGGDDALAELTTDRVVGAGYDFLNTHDVVAAADRLIGDLTSAPHVDCVTYGVGDLRYLAEHVFAHVCAHGLAAGATWDPAGVLTDAECSMYEDELASLADDPRRYAEDACADLPHTVEHLRVVFTLVAGLLTLAAVDPQWILDTYVDGPLRSPGSEIAA